MINKESLLRFQEKADMFITSITRNKITEHELGSMKFVIHERRRGRWTKVYLPFTETPLRGKVHDIVYTIFDGQVERQRLGKMAAEDQALQTSTPELETASVT